MKRLLIARHAKSSWKDTNLSDFERPLNKRGKRDLQTIIPILSHLHIRTDEILTSPALRTRLTANALSVVTQPKNIQPTEVARLYSASWETLLDVTSNIDNLHDTVTIVGHNPGLTEFVNALGNIGFDNVPTLGIIIFDLDISHWRDIGPGCGTIRLYLTPKLVPEL